MEFKYIYNHPYYIRLINHPFSVFHRSSSITSFLKWLYVDHSLIVLIFFGGDIILLFVFFLVESKNIHRRLIPPFQMVFLLFTWMSVLSRLGKRNSSFFLIIVFYMFLCNFIEISYLVSFQNGFAIYHCPFK